jgi:hypothetical protein
MDRNSRNEGNSEESNDSGLLQAGLVSPEGRKTDESEFLITFSSIWAYYIFVALTFVAC